MGPRPPPGRSSKSKSVARWSLPITSLLLFMAAQQSTTAVPQTTGWIIIVGGMEGLWFPSTPYSETLYGPALPQFPVAVYGNTLSLVGDSVYSCGGDGGNSYKKCWVIDTGTEDAAWRSFDIPWPIAYHTAVVVQEEIWFFLDTTLRILNTRNPANDPREIFLDFRFYPVNCVVAQGSNTFVISRSEVLVNSDHSKPQEWGRFSTLLQDRYAFGCHVFGEEVFVTGGFAWPSGSPLSSVEAISVVDGTVRSIGPLGQPRGYHQMAIIEGELAVLGGWNGVWATDTIETYDVPTNSWKNLFHTMFGIRFFFGLTQFLP